MSNVAVTLAPPTPARLTIRSIGLGSMEVPVLATVDRDGLRLMFPDSLSRQLGWVELRSYSVSEGDGVRSLTVQLGPYREELVVETDSRQTLLAWAQALDAHELRQVNVSYGFD